MVGLERVVKNIAATIGVITNVASQLSLKKNVHKLSKYEGWNFNSGNYLFTTDTK